LNGQIDEFTLALQSYYPNLIKETPEIIAFEYEVDTLLAMTDYYQKSIYMESTSDASIPDTISKWERFKNWVSRIITTVTVFFQKRFFKDKLNHTNIDHLKDNPTVRKNDEAIFEILLASLNPYLTGIPVIQIKIRDHGFTFDKQWMKDYRKHVQFYNQSMDKLDQLMKNNEQVVPITKQKLKEYISLADKLGCELVEILPKLNGRLKSMKQSLSSDVLKSNEFRQFVHLLTLSMKCDLKLIKFLTDFLKHVVGKQLDSNPDDGKIDQSQQEDGPEWVKSAKDLMTVSAVDSNKRSLIKSNAKSHFKKHPDCQVVFMKLDKDNNTVLTVWKEGSEWENASWEIDDKLTGALKLFRGLVRNTFKSIGSVYLTRKQVLG